jgi:alkaline phosphatase D
MHRPSGLSRRAWTRLALAMALAPWMRATAAAGPAPVWRRDPFSLGVASGQPRSDSVVLWTRLAPDPLEPLGGVGATRVDVVCEVFGDAALRQRVWQATLTTDTERGFSVHAVPTGLRPGREYWYRFRSGEAVSPVGRTRTAPAESAQVPRLRLALASCQHFEQGHYAAHREIAGEDLDLVLFVGDYIYESTNPRYRIREHRGGVPQTLDEYRLRHAQYKGDADLRAAHAAHPWILTWDDHEVVNDYTGDRDNRHTDSAQFLRRRAAAYRAYFEHLPLRIGPDPVTGGLRIHDRHSWGRLADLWTLDCRQYRSPHACPDPVRGGGRVVMGCDELADPARSLLGTTQERWLAEGLAGSSKAWRLIAQATQVSSTGVDTPVGRSTFTEAWDGYPVARQRLLQSILDAGRPGTVVLGGDVHMNVAARLRQRPNDPSSPVVASEIVTTSISSRGLGESALARIRESNPDILHARSDERGYTRVDVTPEALDVRFRATPHPAAPDARLQTQARFRIDRGQAEVHPV